MKGSNLGCRKGHPLVQRQVWQRGGGGGVPVPQSGTFIQ